LPQIQCPKTCLKRIRHKKSDVMVIFEWPLLRHFINLFDDFVLY
jgi:hypothetical protein